MTPKAMPSLKTNTILSYETPPYGGFFIYFATKFYSL